MKKNSKKEETKVSKLSKEEKRKRGLEDALEYFATHEFTVLEGAAMGQALSSLGATKADFEKAHKRREELRKQGLTCRPHEKPKESSKKRRKVNEEKRTDK